jgi:hypothetical protein
MRASDLRQSAPEPWWWEPLRFQAVCVAWGLCRQNAFSRSAHQYPAEACGAYPQGADANANRWAVLIKLWENHTFVG